MLFAARLRLGPNPGRVDVPWPNTRANSAVLQHSIRDSPCALRRNNGGALCRLDRGHDPVWEWQLQTVLQPASQELCRTGPFTAKFRNLFSISPIPTSAPLDIRFGRSCFSRIGPISTGRVLGPVDNGSNVGSQAKVKCC